MTTRIEVYAEPLNKSEVEEFIKNPPEDYAVEEKMDDKFADRISFIIHKIAEISDREIIKAHWGQNIEKLMEEKRVYVKYDDYKNGEYLGKEITLYQDSFPIDFLFSDDFIAQAQWELEEWQDNVNASMTNKI